AHVSISAPALGTGSQEVTFGVGHGCAGSDTYRVTVEIPAGVTSVRPMTSDFGKFTTTKDGSGNVTTVTWQKDDANALDDDSAYYKLTLRLRPPNAPFTTIAFKTHQVCRTAAGTVLPPVEWVGLPGDDAGAEPAPTLVVLPARSPGWNKYTVPVDVKNLAIFDDARIVWKGNAAYSKNPNTLAQIKSEAGVTELTELKANDEIWVKY
ncbi:MAG: DUF1775 domain-containing protein, partial [Labilithrix sp.]|nr:DUF1775 domain-containing protein [Labilithrix sp.]